MSIPDPSTQTLDVQPALKPGRVRLPNGDVVAPPDGWVLVPPGDAMLTRRIKEAGPTWTVREKKGNKLFSRGVWAPQATVAKLQAQVQAAKATPEYAARLASDAQRRQREQDAYIRDFAYAVRQFLKFAPQHSQLEANLAAAITTHATPVGSGTVARTERIPLPDRARAAVIAWLRHQTTDYDQRHIARIQGERRAVRRALADQSVTLLAAYRRGETVDAETCPLQRALRQA